MTTDEMNNTRNTESAHPEIKHEYPIKRIASRVAWLAGVFPWQSPVDFRNQEERDYSPLTTALTESIWKAIQYVFSSLPDLATLRAMQNALFGENDPERAYHLFSAYTSDIDYLPGSFHAAYGLYTEAGMAIHYQPLGWRMEFSTGTSGRRVVVTPKLVYIDFGGAGDAPGQGSVTAAAQVIAALRWQMRSQFSETFATARAICADPKERGSHSPYFYTSLPEIAKSLTEISISVNFHQVEETWESNTWGGGYHLVSERTLPAVEPIFDAPLRWHGAEPTQHTADIPLSALIDDQPLVSIHPITVFRSDFQNKFAHVCENGVQFGAYLTPIAVPGAERVYVAAEWAFVVTHSFDIPLIPGRSFQLYCASEFPDIRNTNLPYNHFDGYVVAFDGEQMVAVQSVFGDIHEYIPYEERYVGGQRDEDPDHMQGFPFDTNHPSNPQTPEWLAERIAEGKQKAIGRPYVFPAARTNQRIPEIDDETVISSRRIG